MHDTEPPPLSPRQLAEALGVSESSVKRWADSGRIPTVRTAGGHRRIPVAHAVAFARAAGLDVAKPESLGLEGVPRVRAGRSEPWTESFEPLLRRGRREEFVRALMAAHLAGESVATLCDGPLRAALASVGELWRDDVAGVFVEHRATAIAVGALARLRQLQPVGVDAPIAVGGAVAGDPSQLPSAMCAAALASEGFDAVDLGADTPPAALLAAVQEHAPRLVWLSANHVADPAAAGRAVDELADALAARDIPCVLGGRASATLRSRRRAFVQPAGTIAELAAFARGLSAVPRK